MKLKVPAIFSQRDSKWASQLLGYNTSIYTIGGYGCLITCLGMYINETPDAVNATLVQGNGYQAGGGLFVWSKSTLLGITESYASPRYDGIPVTSQGFTKIKQLLDSGLPLLTEIDFNPNTNSEEMHFVLIYGYENDTYYACDPWTGTQIDLGVYGGPARAIIQFRAYDKILPVDDGTMTIPVDSKVFENLVRKSTIYDAIVSKLNVADSQTIVLAEIDKNIGYEDAVAQKDKQLSDAQATIGQLQQTASQKETELKDLQSQVADLSQKVQTAVQENQNLQKSLQEAQDAAKMPILTGWKKWLYDTFIK